MKEEEEEEFRRDSRNRLKSLYINYQLDALIIIYVYS